MNAVVHPLITLQVLEQRLRDAKAKEAAARDERLAVEDLIVNRFVPPEGGEGSTKEGGLSIAWKVTRKVDASLADHWPTLGKNAQQAFKWKPEIDLKSLRALQQMDPEGYAQAAKFITATPSKPAVTLKDEG